MGLGEVIGNGLRAAVGPEAAIYALAAIGLNVHFGYTGLLNFGQAGFMLVGAYGLAVTVAIWNGSFWIGVVLGLALAAVLAGVLGAATLRLRTDYLAIATIAAAEILRFAFRSNAARPWTGGVFGLQQFAGSFFSLNPIPVGNYGIGPVVFSERRLWVVLVGWALVALSCVFVLALMHSPWGRVVRAIREDEAAVHSLGKNVFRFKMQSFVIGGVLGGLGGVMLAINQQAVNPDTYMPIVTFYAYTLLLLGGAARVLGPVVGSVLFWFLVSVTDSLLRRASEGVLPLAPDGIGAVRFTLVGIGLMLLVVWRPQGVLGDRREIQFDR